MTFVDGVQRTGTGHNIPQKFVLERVIAPVLGLIPIGTIEHKRILPYLLLYC